MTSKANDPVDARVRLAIAQWPSDAPRGAVTAFCAEHGLSRETFYVIRRRAVTEGQAAALEPRTRRPKRSPAQIAEPVRLRALGVRSALERSGLDHGPISVHEKMKALGMVPVPSTASLARIFRDADVAARQPRKKPRSAWRRFVYPAPNACWQLDGTEYVLTGGRKCVIFQLEDDHSRLAVASHAAWAETAEGAVEVVKKGIAAHGVPQRLLSDNGAALNPTRRGFQGQLTTYLAGLGVEAITGKPYKPTTQGKNERFHQTLFRYLDKQPLAASLDELQAQIDAFDRIYNTERPHQALPGRMTPQAAWDATPKADPPQPPVLLPTAESVERNRTPDGIWQARVQQNGTVSVRGVHFSVTSQLRGQPVHVVTTDTNVSFFDYEGTLIIEQLWPAPGVNTSPTAHPEAAATNPSRPMRIRDCQGCPDT